MWEPAKAAIVLQCGAVQSELRMPVSATPNKRLQIGGMAFGNGVVMRGPKRWAWARADGSVLEGAVKVHPRAQSWAKLPLVRSLISLWQMLAFSVQLHRLNGRRGGYRLLVWLLAFYATDLGLGYILYLILGETRFSQMVLQIVSFALVLLSLPLAWGSGVLRYHGAEHKAVNAHERGADLTDVNEVMRHSRVHDRCGTNFAAIVVVLGICVYVPLQAVLSNWAISLLLGLLIDVVALEIFRVCVKHPTSWLSRLVLSGGRLLQWAWTTREPEPQHVELACKALQRVIMLENSSE